MDEMNTLTCDAPSQNLYSSIEKCCEPSISKRLKMKQERLSTELNWVNKALEALEKSPEVKQAFDLVSLALGRL